MSLIESLQLSESQLDTIDNNTSIVCMDANLAEEQMARVVQRCQQWNVPLIFEPTSAPKATKLVNVIKRLSKRPPLYITPDLAEAKVIAAAIQSDTKMQRREWDESMVPPSITKSEIRHIAAVIASCFDKVIFKMGRNGVLLSQKCAETRFVHWDHLTPSVVKSSVVSVTGAGDSLVGALCSGVTLDPDSFPKDLSKFARMVKSSMTASELSLDTSRAVSELLGPDIFKKLQ